MSEQQGPDAVAGIMEAVQAYGDASRVIARYPDEHYEDYQEAFLQVNAAMDGVLFAVRALARQVEVMRPVVDAAERYRDAGGPRQRQIERWAFNAAVDGYRRNAATAPPDTP